MEFLLPGAHIVTIGYYFYLQRKCDQYWPNEGETQYGQLTVKLLNYYRMAHYSIRVFTVKCQKPKKVSIPTHMSDVSLLTDCVTFELYFYFTPENFFISTVRNLPFQVVDACVQRGILLCEVGY